MKHKWKANLWTMQFCSEQFLPLWTVSLSCLFPCRTKLVLHETMNTPVEVSQTLHGLQSRMSHHSHVNLKSACPRDSSQHTHTHTHTHTHSEIIKPNAFFSHSSSHLTNWTFHCNMTPVLCAVGHNSLDAYTHTHTHTHTHTKRERRYCLPLAVCNLSSYQFQSCSDPVQFITISPNKLMITIRCVK